MSIATLPDAPPVAAPATLDSLADKLLDDLKGKSRQEQRDILLRYLARLLATWHEPGSEARR